VEAEFLPWQNEHARRWLARGDGLAHAWLVYGQSGIGKRQFALGLAASLLCESPKDLIACGKCQACLWVRLDHHPDLMRVRPEAAIIAEGLGGEAEVDGSEKPRQGSSKPSEIIKIDQIRELEPWYHRTTHRAGWRIVVLYPAESMMAEGANALLKALEEPPPNTMFLLVADSPDRLLPTIVSRCQKLMAPVPSVNEALSWLVAQGVSQPEQWLDLAGGAPIKARELAASLAAPYPGWLQDLLQDLAKNRPVAIATVSEEMIKVPATQWLPDLQRLAIDLCLCRAGLAPRYFSGLRDLMHAVAARVPLQSLTRLQADVTKRVALAGHPLNPRLFAQVCLQQITEALS